MNKGKRLAKRPATAMRLRTILVVITNPFARQQPALAKAAAMARRCRARMVLFNSFMVPQPVADVPMDSRGQIIAAAIRQRRERMQEAARKLRLQRARCVVEWDYPAHEAIVRQVLRTRPGMLVTDSHRHGRLVRLLLANTDWELMRACPCPMWFVRSASLPRRPQLLVAVDPRHTHAKPARLDDRMLRTARALASQLDGRVSIVHAYESPLTSVPGMLMEPIRVPISPQHARDFIAKTTSMVNRLAARHRVDPADRVLQEGAAREVIPAVARRNRADLLVMGAVSRSRLIRPLIGSTAEAVIDQVECDVLVVKPAGFRTPVKRAALRI